MIRALSIGLCALGLTANAAAGQWSVGPVGIMQASPYVGGESGFMFVPAVAYQGEKLVVRGPFADYFLVGGQPGEMSVALTLGLGPNQLEVDGDARLAGIEDRDSGLLGGVRVDYPVWGGTASFALQTDITSESEGQRAVIGWQKPLFNTDPRKWIFSAGVEVEYTTSDYANFYYGVSNAEAAASEFAAYESGSVVQPSITVGGYYNFDKNWQLIYNMSWQVLASDVEDSPIVDQSGVASGVIGVVYNF